MKHPETLRQLMKFKKAPTKSTFPNYESNPRIQMMQEKREH